MTKEPWELADNIQWHCKRVNAVLVIGPEFFLNHGAKIVCGEYDHMEAPNGCCSFNNPSRISTIYLPVPPTTILAYWTAMHELGHAYLNHINDPSIPSQFHLMFGIGLLPNEQKAWDWAVSNSCIEMSWAAREMMNESLKSYRALENQWTRLLQRAQRLHS